MGDKYVSDHTKFIAEMKSKDPGIEEGQRRGRAIYWDKRIDLDEEKRFHQSEVAQPAYAYQNSVGPERNDGGNGENTAAGAKPGDVKTPGTPATNKS